MVRLKNKWLEDLVFSHKEGFYLSQIAKKDAVWSMAAVGDLKKLPKGEVKPIYEDGKKVGTVKVPLEFYELVPISTSVSVWASNVTEDGKSSAFKVEAHGDWDVAEVRFDWGLTHGMRNLSFRCFGLYPCNIPEGFSLSALVKLLTKGSIKDFILKYSTVSNTAKSRMLKRGL